MPIFILYIIPLVIFILLLAPKFIGLRRLLKNADSTEKKEEILNDLKEAFEKSTKFSASLKELINIKPVVLSQIWFFVKTVSFIYMLPVFLLRMSLIFRLGSKISWQLPVSLYEVWQALFLILSYYYSHRQSPILGLALAILVGISSFYYLFSDFECKEDGTLSILARPLHKLNFRELFEAGLIVIFSYAAVFYSLNILYTNSFSSKLTILDSLYFSLITVATVGYGDINPVSNPAKILVMSEILFGLLFMLVIVSVFLSVFIKLHADEQDKAK